MTWRGLIALLSWLFAIRGGRASDLPVITEGMTRRSFLTALGVSAGALATAGFDLDVPLLLDEPIPGVGWDLGMFDSILREVYAPGILAQLQEENVILKLMAREDQTPAKNWLPVHYARNSA